MMGNSGRVIMSDKIRKDVLEIVGTVIEKDPEKIPLDAHLVQDMGADSMMALEILAAIEKKFRIVIPEERLKDMTTANHIIKLVENSPRKK
jgi:acyl carrier protein